MPNSWHGHHLGCHPVIDGVRNLYGYQPSLAAGVFFSILFSILMILHVVHCIRRKTWWCMVFAIGCLVEVLGWAARTWSAKCPYTKSAFLMQLATLVIGQNNCDMLRTGIYLLLGYIIRIFGRKSSYFRSDCYFWFFTVCDLISLAVQAVGGALASAALSAHRDMSNGTHIMIAGIAFQMASTIAFATCMVDCVLRTIYPRQGTIPKGVSCLFAAMVLSVLCICTRSIYRLAELSQGWTGYLITHEKYFIILDAVMMAIAVGVFVIFHPSLMVSAAANPPKGRRYRELAPINVQ
ncbi:RTA1 like protein-domain-containing protein [Aspergillus novoparasiticus]|uniref:RTA1 like protein-domain-containing protein n=1 Tax=Aspergillus novoparasiticus TaxID=986946 RepID=A0A5N6EWC9_9EURO|nr:RTA1 like protein-domain-containing protein [Aspergillus novoparasiticus]